MPAHPQSSTRRTLVDEARGQVQARRERPVDAAARGRAERSVRHSYRLGLLDHDELEQRLDLACRASTVAQLRQATRGLRSPEPQIVKLRATSAGLTTVIVTATLTWLVLLAAAAAAWPLGAGPAVAAILAVLVTVLYAAATRPVRRRRTVTRAELHRMLDLPG